MKAQPAIDRARQAVAAGAIDGVLAENAKRGKGNDAGQFSEDTQIERRQEKPGIDRDQKGNRNQEAEQKLERRAGIFKRLAGDFGIRPEEAPHIGCQPEAVNAERDHQQHSAANEQPPIVPALPEELHAAARCDPACIEAGHGQQG